MSDQLQNDVVDPPLGDDWDEGDKRVADAHAAGLLNPLIARVICLDCGWRGLDSELLAQACPVCDGRCADV